MNKKLMTEFGIYYQKISKLKTYTTILKLTHVNIIIYFKKYEGIKGLINYNTKLYIIKGENIFSFCNTFRLTLHSTQTE